MNGQKVTELRETIGLSKVEMASIMLATVEDVEKWEAGESEPKWTQSLKMMVYITKTPGVYSATLEDDLEFKEEVERKITQASSTTNLLYQTTSETSGNYGVISLLSDTLSELKSMFSNK